MAKKIKSTIENRQKKPSKRNLHDTQNEKDFRSLPINKVGIRNLKYPIAVKDKDIKIQHTIATISMYVDLPKQYKGTHMSRFLEIMESNKREIHINSIFNILDRMKKKFESHSCSLRDRISVFYVQRSTSFKAKNL